MHCGAVGVAAHSMHQGRDGVALQSRQCGSVGYSEQSLQPGCDGSARQIVMHRGRNGISEQSNSVGSITLMGAGVGGVGGLVGGRPVHCGVSRARSPSLVTACPSHVEQ
jgi:hypothetical protein